jgi:hypothetical protein
MPATPFFSPYYWGGVGAAVTGPTPTPTPGELADLLSAVIARLRADPGVRAVLTSPSGAVQVWFGAADPNVDPPYVVLTGYVERDSGPTAEDVPADVMVEVYAYRMDQADTIAEAVKAAIDTPNVAPGTPPRPRLRWRGGEESGLDRTGSDLSERPGYGRGGKRVFRETIRYRFWVRPA